MNTRMVVTKVRMAMANENRGCDESAFCGDERMVWL